MNEYSSQEKFKLVINWDKIFNCFDFLWDWVIIFEKENL